MNVIILGILLYMWVKTSIKEAWSDSAHTDVQTFAHQRKRTETL